MHQDPFFAAVRTICASDPRYAPDAYLFVRQALDFASKILDKPREGPQRHVSGSELLEGIRKFALQEFGPMALTVLRSWGVTSTAALGDIVFNLVDGGILGKTDSDRREDFDNGYDFREAFAEPFLPRAGTARPRARTGKTQHNNDRRTETAS